jgi:acetoin utilization deacetylase AcuC-like enzyme
MEPTTPRDSPEPKRRLRNLLEVAGLLEVMTPLRVRRASDDELRLAHDGTYVAEVRRAGGDGGMLPGDYMGIGLDGFRIAAIAAGACVVAVDAVLSGEVDNAYALVRPPGHHAGRSIARGGCVFNNVAVAASHALAAGVDRVAVLDIDAHHGNGTQEIFYDSSHVLTISIHQNQTFAAGTGGVDARGHGEGRGYNINIPLPAGSGRGAYLEVLAQIVAPALDWFNPGLILVACGLDANTQDPSARMMLHSEAFAAITSLLVACARRVCRGRIVLCQEGGYSEWYVPFCGLAVVEELLGCKSGIEDPFLSRWTPFSGDPLMPHQADAVRSAAFGLPFTT